MSNDIIKNLKINRKSLALLLTAAMTLNTTPMFKQKAIAKADEITTNQYVMQNDYVLSTSKVNMRTNSGFYGEIICEIKKNEELKRILSYNDWNLVIYKDKIGFVYDNYIKDISDSNSDLKIEKKDGYVTAKTGINLRLGPSTDDKVIGSIFTGEITEVLGKTNDNWYLVFYKGKIGYVSADKKYVDYSESFDFSKNTDGKLYAYTTSNVNFRVDPMKDSDKIELLKKGEQIEILSQEDNGWYKVLYSGIEGYISDSYVDFNPKDGYRDDFIKVVYATEDLGIKNQLYDDSYSIYDMSKYETCEVLRETTDKYFVRCGGYLGYIPKEKTAGLYNTFVVIDISSQKLTLYHNNKILIETDVVTGQKYEYDTPTGIYSIRKKEIDTFLTGEDYFTHVNYWMPFNGGIGLHDAEWRSKFGGKIYERDGSHGCINIPPKYTDDIFDSVDKGTKVLVQK